MGSLTATNSIGSTAAAARETMGPNPSSFHDAPRSNAFRRLFSSPYEEYTNIVSIPVNFTWENPSARWGTR